MFRKLQKFSMSFTTLICGFFFLLTFTLGISCMAVVCNDFYFQIIVSVQYGRCKLELKRDKEVIVDIDSPELHQSQYHTADFDTSKI